MNSEPSRVRLADYNPFSTRGVRPGAVPYLFPDDWDAARLVDRLRGQGWRGEIVGPHGSGKSALLHSLIPALRAAGREVALFVLQAGESRLPKTPRPVNEWNASTMVVIDGFEQLGWWSRWRLRRRCRRAGCGLLVTTHAPTGLPGLWRTEPTLETTRRLVRGLQAGGELRVRDRDVEIAFAAHRGDIREVLFELHDIYAQRTA